MFCFPVWMITTQQTMELAHSEVDLGRTLWSQIIAVTPIGYHRPICQPHSSQQMYESHARHCMTLIVNKIPPNTQTNYGGWPIEKQCNQFTCFLFLYARLIYKTWLVKYEFWWDKSVNLYYCIKRNVTLSTSWSRWCMKTPKKVTGNLDDHWRNIWF